MTKLSLQRLLQFANLLGVSIPTAGTVSFPPPTGPYDTALTTAELIDYHRIDPFAPIRQPRALMVSVFHPVSPDNCSPTLTSYMVPVTAAFEDAQFAQYGIPPGTFELLNLEVCKTNQRQQRAEHPLILFSPALGTTRLFYSAIAQEVASAGYTVVTIDHPYDADIVTFPNNSTALAVNITDAEVPLALDTRVKDVTFVLNELSKPSFASQLNPGLNCRLDTSKVGIFGHSLGGATAAQAMLFDARLVGGLNLDGSFFGSVVQKGLNRPFLLFGHDGKNTTTDPTWGEIWPELTGFKRELMLADSAHYTFSDLPDIVDVLGIGAALPSEVAQLLGTINGTRAFKIVTVYVRAYFDFVLKGRKSELLEGPSKEFPEVTFESP